MDTAPDVQQATGLHSASARDHTATESGDKTAGSGDKTAGAGDKTAGSDDKIVGAGAKNAGRDDKTAGAGAKNAAVDATDAVAGNLREAFRSRWMEWGARVGMVARSIVYLLIAVLAIQVAFGRHKEADQNGALRTVAHSTGGPLLLGLLAAAFGTYALWRLEVQVNQEQELVPFWMGVAQVGRYVAQVTMTPVGKYDVDQKTFEALLVRARDRLHEVSR